MINRTTFAALAGVTFVLMTISAAVGDDHHGSWIWDAVWVAFLLSAVLLAVLTVGVLARAAMRSRTGDRAQTEQL